SVALVRVEQLYPFPAKELEAIFAAYPEARQVYWVQEEPWDMGAWHVMHRRLPRILHEDRTLDYAGRPAAARPATVSSELPPPARTRQAPAAPAAPQPVPPVPAAPAAPLARAEAEVEPVAARAVGPLSPAVRRLLAEHDLDPTLVPASGKGGRLTKEDVLAYLERSARPVRIDVPAAPKPSAALAEGEERVPMSPIRRRIAERLVQAQHTAAILTTFNELD